MNWTGLKRIDSMTGRDRWAIRESIPRLVLGWAGPDLGGLAGGSSTGARHTLSYSLLPLCHSLCSTVPGAREEAGEGERGVEGGTRALALALGRFRNKHGQAGVSDLDLGGRRSAVIGGLGFGAVVRAWALLLVLVQVLVQVLGASLPTCYSLKFYGV